MSESETPLPPSFDTQPRRSFLTSASGIAMSVGLVAGYGTFATMLGRFVYPTAAQNRSWLFVCTIEALALGEALDFISPAGVKIVVARQGAGTSSEDFLALSSVCPHLGCRVHWEGPQDRFFCPCHNGVFDRQGNPISGPPRASNQPLTRFPLKIEAGLLFIEAPVTTLACRTDAGASPPGTPTDGVA